MALILADRVKDTTTTTGTGAVTLSGTPPTGFQSFSIIGNGNTTYYTIAGGSQWEVGIGTFTSAGNSLSRDTVLASSNANALVSFSAGTKDVFVTYPAGKSVNYDASGNIIVTGSQTFTGVAARIQGDFSNATLNSRTAFQTSTTNGSTGIYAIPNGSSTAASWQAVNGSDPTNASKILIATNASTDVQLVSGINGTGTYLPLTFYNGGSEKMRLDTSGNLGIGTTPNTWSVTGNIQLQASRSLSFAGTANVVSNAYFNSSWTYTTTAAAALYQQSAGAHTWLNAASGTAGTTFTFTTAMTLDTSGNLRLNGSTAEIQLAVGAERTITPSGASGSTALTFKRWNGAAYASDFIMDGAGNLGINTTPSAWKSDWRSIDISTKASFGATSGGEAFMLNNAYVNSSNLWTYKTTAPVSYYLQTAGAHIWYYAPSGTAGTQPTFSEGFRLSATGGFSVGTTTDPGVGKILANNGILPRVNAQTTTTSPWAWNSNTYDQQSFSALANALTINADAGSPTDGQKTMFRIKDNGTTRTLTFTGGATGAFRDLTGQLTVSGSNFTYATVASKITYFGCIYNSADSRWDIVAVTQQP